MCADKHIKCILSTVFSSYSSQFAECMEKIITILRDLWCLVRDYLAIKGSPVSFNSIPRCLNVIYAVK